MKCLYCLLPKNSAIFHFAFRSFSKGFDGCDGVLLFRLLLFICTLYLLLIFSQFLTTLPTLVFPCSCSDVQSNFLIALSLFCCLTPREFETPPCLCPLFFPFQTVDSIKHNDILGEIPRCLCLWAVWALWPIQASLNLFKPFVARDTSLEVSATFLDCVSGPDSEKRCTALWNKNKTRMPFVLY